jgi:hypothetical protein
MMALVCAAQSSFSYYENWPPYFFKQGPFKRLDLKPLPDKDIPSFIKDHSDLESYGVSKFYSVYEIDIDGNGLNDYIVLLCPMGSTLLWAVDIYLQKQKGSHEKISYVSCGAALEDFVDINKDGHYEVIIGSLYEGEKHNYMAYSIHQFKNYRLINADKKFKAFPKFVWMTNKLNEEDTVHLSTKERQKHVAEKDSSIKYENIY